MSNSNRVSLETDANSDGRQAVLWLVVDSDRASIDFVDEVAEFAAATLF